MKRPGTPRIQNRQYVVTFIITVSLLNLLATESPAKLIVENSERLAFLVEGMDAALDRIRTIRGDVNSVEVYLARGEPRVDIINKTRWISKGVGHRFVNQLTQLYDGKLPPKPKPGQKHAPVGERVTECACSGGLLVEVRPRDRKAIIADWKKRPASTLQDRANHEPHFYGARIKGLSLSDIVVNEGYWYRLPETMDPAAQRSIKWAGKKEYKGRETDVVELSVKWTGTDGTVYEHRFEILVEPSRGFTVPFMSETYTENDGPLQPVETVETECVDYGGGIWGPKKTVCTCFFTTEKGRGKSVSTITVEHMEFNTLVTDKELMVTLEDGTRVNDQIASELLRYTLVDEKTLLESMRKSHRKAGYTNPTPIAPYDPDSARGIELGRTRETDVFTTFGSKPSSSAIEPERGNRTKRAILWAGTGVLVVCFALASVFIFKAYRHQRGST